MNYTHIITLIAALSCGSAAFAQIHKMERRDSAMTSRTYNLNPVVVTGSGHHQRLKSTATPVHVLQAQEIREQGITTFDDALVRMMPQVSMAPNSMGTFLRLNGLGNKYILILINGQKLSGDISNNVDLSRINMARVKRIEVLDGAASSLYGSDAIAGVINIITDQPTTTGSFPVSVTSDTKVSGHGVLTESVNLDIYKNGFGSYTSFTHDRADSYQNNPLEYIKGSDTETQRTIAPYFTGYRSSIIGQRFTFAPTDHLALNAGLDYSYKITDRPNTATAPAPSASIPSGSATAPNGSATVPGGSATVPGGSSPGSSSPGATVPGGSATVPGGSSPGTTTTIPGGTDYEMRYKGLRWNVGGIYKFTNRHSLQADFVVDRFRYGKEYDVDLAAKGFPLGTYIQSKKQRSMEGELKAILDVPALFGNNTGNQTTILGADWRKDYLTATSGNIHQHAYTTAAYAQHEVKHPVGNGTATATVGLRYTHHETFGNHLTPKATLMYSLGAINLRATYSAGFRAPGLDEIYYHYFSVNRGKAQIIFGNSDLKPEKSHYVSLNAEYRTQQLAVSVTGYLNRINDMVIRHDIGVDATTLAMLRQEFPEMTDDQSSKLKRYSRYENSDKGDVKGVQVNVSANVMPGLNLSANYAYTYARSLSGDEWTLLERSIRHAATISANYHHSWGRYKLNVNLNGKMQSKTYYTSYENAPGYGLWNLQTTHSIDLLRHVLIEPSIGIDNIFDRVDRRIDSSQRKYALYTPGRMLVVGMRVKLK